ncbi:MAG: hypothetical protein PVSMB1_07520 [Gemmatimonadaceae bacterium]
MRVAVGANTRDVVRLVLAQGAIPTAIGMACGMVCALLLARVLSTLLYGVGSVDPTTLAAVVLIVVVAGAVAMLVPARQAAGVDPLIALRSD